MSAPQGPCKFLLVHSWSSLNGTPATTNDWESFLLIVIEQNNSFQLGEEGKH